MSSFYDFGNKEKIEQRNDILQNLKQCRAKIIDLSKSEDTDNDDAFYDNPRNSIASNHFDSISSSSMPTFLPLFDTKKSIEDKIAAVVDPYNTAIVLFDN